MLFAIAEIGRRPVHAAVFTTDSAGWAATKALRLDALRRLGEAGIRPLLAPAQAGTAIADQVIDDLVDWMLRILISYAALPGPADLEPDGHPAPPPHAVPARARRPARRADLDLIG